MGAIYLSVNAVIPTLFPLLSMLHVWVGCGGTDCEVSILPVMHASTVYREISAL